jgi:anhydro-N-acetylmuramic acid kinase
MMRILGLMSGTSLDGVDAALIETDGERVRRTGLFAARPYAPAERDLLRRALADAAGLTDRDARPGCLAQAETLVTQAHARAVKDWARLHGQDLASIDCIGFHGQTVLHRPALRLTVQIGDGPGLARLTGRPVVHDLRAADMVAGGQGAPLVPVYHRALAAARSDLPMPLVVANIGGVSNITFIDGLREPVACDTGPGNALIDDLMLERSGEPIDRDGATAATGRVDEAALARLLDHPFFALKPPKSLDRNAFDRSAVDLLSTPDAAATLTAFTARSLAAIARHLPDEPQAWVICGGGARNPTLLAHLRAATNRPVLVADEIGWSGEAMEAEAFAFLAARHLLNLPISFPGTTGVAMPVTGGRLARP